MKDNKTSTSKKSSRKLSAKNTRKVSLKEIAQKTRELLKKPFSSKDPKKAKKQPPKAKRSPNKDRNQQLEHSMTLKENAKQQIQKKRLKSLENDAENLGELDHNSDEEHESSKTNDLFAQASSEVNGFFYTNDKFFNRVEDGEMLRYLQRAYPLFMRNQNDLTTQKKQILEMLQNAKFMESFLSYYDMTIYDFFKYLFRIEPDIFKGSFLTRVQKAMRYKKYALDARKSTHFRRKSARLKASQPKPRI